MKLTRTRHIYGAADGKPQPPQVAKSESRSIVPLNDLPFARRRPLGANPIRRSSAFLAHLALQYDGISARRLQRVERLNAAISGYGAQAAKRNRPRLRPTRDLRI